MYIGQHPFMWWIVAWQNQAIIQTTYDDLWIEPLETNFDEVWMKIKNF